MSELLAVVHNEEWKMNATSQCIGGAITDNCVVEQQVEPHRPVYFFGWESGFDVLLEENVLQSAGILRMCCR
ncbi:hypothetical protein Y032_0130g1522 [Ancylostoma ceylanicum]|nr:hypothetical protein Y032_0130g1522 [Ancylostoma ceylanicum]